jgi:sec-independent protein translocase protein TatA
MILGLGIPELLVILIIALVIFGPKNLPKLGKSLGETVKNVREGMEGDEPKQVAEQSVASKVEEQAVASVVEPVAAEPVATEPVAVDANVEEDVVFCSKCGAKNAADAAFCSKCGAKLAS